MNTSIKPTKAKSPSNVAKSPSNVTKSKTKETKTVTPTSGIITRHRSSVASIASKKSSSSSCSSGLSSVDKDAKGYLSPLLLSSTPNPQHRLNSRKELPKYKSPKPAVNKSATASIQPGVSANPTISSCSSVIHIYNTQHNPVTCKLYFKLYFSYIPSLLSPLQPTMIWIHSLHWKIRLIPPKSLSQCLIILYQQRHTVLKMPQSLFPPLLRSSWLL